MKETYMKFEDFAKRANEGKETSEVFFQQNARVEWEEQQGQNGIIKVPRVVAFVKLTAFSGEKRNLIYSELLANDYIGKEGDEQKINEKIKTGVSDIIARLQDKCPKCRLFEGTIE